MNLIGSANRTAIVLNTLDVTYLEIPEHFNVPMNIIELPARREVTFLERTVRGPQGAPDPGNVVLEYVVITTDTVAEYGKFYVVDLRGAFGPLTITAPANNITGGKFGVADGFLKSSQIDIITEFTLLYGESGTYTLNFNAGDVMFTNTGTTAGWIKKD